MGLCCGHLAVHSPSAVVGDDDVAVFHAWQKGEVMVMGLCAKVNKSTISAELIPSDDAIGVFWWSPANLH